MVLVLGVATVRLGPKRVGELEVAAIFVGLAWWRIELAFFAAFVVAFLGGAITPLDHWNIAAPGLILLIAMRELYVGGRAIVPWPLLAYLGSFALALHAGLNTASGPAVIQYAIGPSLALVTAWASRSPRVRHSIVLMTVAFSVIEFFLVLIQAVTSLNTLGAGSYSQFADGITGAAGANGSGRVMVVSVIAATIVLAMMLERIGPRPVLLVVLVALVSVGVLDVAKAVFFMAPVALGAVLLASGRRREAGRWTKRLLAVLTVLVMAPVLIVVAESLYPHSTAPVTSLSSLQDTTFSASDNTKPDAPLPRGIQLENALSLAKKNGVGAAVLGHGLGVTKLTAIKGINNSPAANMQLTAAQGENNLWFARLIVETGWFGVAAWAALLSWMLILARRARRVARPRSLDAAAALSLFGVVPLMVLSSFYDTSAVSDISAMALWTLVGVVASIAYGPRTDQSVSASTFGPPADSAADSGRSAGDASSSQEYWAHDNGAA